MKTENTFAFHKPFIPSLDPGDDSLSWKEFLDQILQEANIIHHESICYCFMMMDGDKYHGKIQDLRRQIWIDWELPGDISDWNEDSWTIFMEGIEEISQGIFERINNL